MLHYPRKLPSFNTVAAGSESSLNVPLGPTYRDISLEYKEAGAFVDEATIKASIARIQVKVNGRAIIDVSCKHAIDVFMTKAGNPYSAANGIVRIPFTRRLKTLVAEEQLALGTKNIESLELVVTLAAGATTPSLKANAVQTQDSRDIGLVIHVLEFQKSTAVTGVFELANLPKQNGALFAMHLDNANITDVAVKMNNVEAMEGSPAYLHSVFEANGNEQFNAVTDYVHIEPTFLRRLDDMYPLTNLQDFRIDVDISVAGNVPIIMETVKNPLISQ